jgi:hypothetical protein
MAMSKIRSYQEQVQEIVEKAINMAEEQYKALADMSFGYAEKLVKLETVKSKHDDFASRAYKAARDVNKKIGDYTGELIAKFEKEEGTVKATAKKATAAAKKKVAEVKEEVTAA